MNTLYIGIKISGSGSTTFFDKMLPNAIKLNADNIRLELCGDASDQSKNKEVFDTLYERLALNLTLNENDIVVDNTTLTIMDRQKIIAFRNNIDCNYNIVLVYFVPNIEVAKLRNSKRERQVPEYVIDKQYKRLEGISDYEREHYNIVEIVI